MRLRRAATVVAGIPGKLGSCVQEFRFPRCGSNHSSGQNAENGILDTRPSVILAAPGWERPLVPVIAPPYSSNVMDASKRILVLPAAAAIIGGLCAWKLSRPVEQRTFVPPPLMVALPPRLEFDLFDQQKPPERVRLRSFVGRHSIVVVFFDPASGANADPVLVRLRREIDAVQDRSVKVLGVSTALPQENRPLVENDPRQGRDARDRTPFPFPLLTDLPPDCSVHRAWSRYDAKAKQSLPGVFLIDRAGRIAWDKDRDAPEPLHEPMQVLDELLGR